MASGTLQQQQGIVLLLHQIQVIIQLWIVRWIPLIGFEPSLTSFWPISLVSLQEPLVASALNWTLHTLPPLRAPRRMGIAREGRHRLLCKDVLQKNRHRYKLWHPGYMPIIWQSCDTCPDRPPETPPRPDDCGTRLRRCVSRIPS